MLLSRRVIQAEVGTLPNSGLMELGIFGEYEGMKWIASHLNSFELLNLQLGMESGLLFLFFSFFSKKITSLSLADIT